jgi:hypothetical protein
MIKPHPLSLSKGEGGPAAEYYLAFELALQQQGMCRFHICKENHS